MHNTMMHLEVEEITFLNLFPAEFVIKKKSEN